MACTSGCKTRDHASYSECLKDKAPRVAYCNSAGGMDFTAQRQWDRDLDAYKDARRQGIQPATTKRKDVDAAVHMSNKTGAPYQA